MFLPKIVQCESTGNPQAQNPTSSASGLYQETDETWRGTRGAEGAPYAHAKDAPVAIQVAAARRLFRARGTQPWVSSQSCWG